MGELHRAVRAPVKNSVATQITKGGLELRQLLSGEHGEELRLHGATQKTEDQDGVLDLRALGEDRGDELLEVADLLGSRGLELEGARYVTAYQPQREGWIALRVGVEGLAQFVRAALVS